jgi:RNA polymerase sigma-70 factor (family 1)
MHLPEDKMRSDHELLHCIAGGDQRAFATLFDRHWKKLYHTALNVVEDRDAAEDIVQECFISLWEKSAHKHIDNVGGYLFKSVKYACFMYLRSGAISRKHLDHINQLTFDNSTEEDFYAQELQEVLDSSMATLPEKCREIFYLSRFEFLPNKQIAEQLQISPKTVENQITKALRILRLSVNKMISVAVFLTVC